MFTPLGFDHVVLRVRDQAASERFYREVLGCTLDRVNPRFSIVHLRFGEQMIDLVPALPDAPPPAGREVAHVCLSIRCDDLEALARDFRARGVAVDDEVTKRYGAYGDGPSVYLRDPDGHTLELKPR